MILIAIIYIATFLIEYRQFKGGKQEISKYIIVISILFIVSELLYYYRDTFQIAMLLNHDFKQQ